jgi:hypothetical protein
MVPLRQRITLNQRYTNLKVLLSATVLALVLIPQSSWAGDPLRVQSSDGQTANTPPTPAGPSTVPAAPDAKPGRSTAAILLGTDSAKPIPVGWTLSAQVQNSVDAAKTTRTEFLKTQQDLRNGMRKMKEAARDRLRDDLQKGREDFLINQRQVRDEVKKQVAALKEQLQDHRTLIDEAKGEAKERVRARKDD